jgi:hypothetical protein
MGRAVVWGGGEDWWDERMRKARRKETGTTKDEE